MGDTRSVAALLLLMGAVACNAVIQSPPDAEPQAGLREFAESPPDLTPMHDAVTAARLVVGRSRAAGRDEARGRNLEALRLAHAVHDSAEVSAHAVALGFVPPLREAAQRRLHLVINVSSLNTTWPPGGGVAPPKVRERAARRRRRLKPGELAILYAKGGANLKVQLFDANGLMRPEAYMALCHALYEPHHDAAPIEQPWIAYDPRLFTLMYYAGQHFDRPIEVISAYRGHGGRTTSNHSLGRAMDIVIDGEKRRVVMAYFERSFGQIGVGWYPRSTFIHVDTRERSYYWTDTSAPGKAQRVHERKIVNKPLPGTDPTARTIHVPLGTLYQ